MILSLGFLSIFQANEVLFDTSFPSPGILRFLDKFSLVINTYRSRKMAASSDGFEYVGHQLTKHPNTWLY